MLLDDMSTERLFVLFVDLAEVTHRCFVVGINVSVQRAQQFRIFQIVKWKLLLTNNALYDLVDQLEVLLEVRSV